MIRGFLTVQVSAGGEVEATCSVQRTNLPIHPNIHRAMQQEHVHMQHTACVESRQHPTGNMQRAKGNHPDVPSHWARALVRADELVGVVVVHGRFERGKRLRHGAIQNMLQVA